MIRSFINVFFISLFFSFNLFGQDLIVTNQGDSLNCTITKKDKGFVYFVYRQPDNAVKRTLLPVNNIRSVQEGDYPKPPMPFFTPRLTDYSKWRFGAHGGYSYRMAKISDQIPSQYKDYIRKLKSGFVIGGDVHYFTSEVLGFGLKCNLNKYKSNLSPDFKDNVSLNYIAASMLNRVALRDKKSSILFGVNLGFQSYKDVALLNMEDITIKGKSAGLGIEAGIDHKVSSTGALNFGIALNIGNIYNVTVDNGIAKTKVKLEKENAESLSRIELVVGFKFLK